MLKTESVKDENGEYDGVRITSILPEREFSDCAHENPQPIHLRLKCINSKGEETHPGGIFEGGHFDLCPDCGAFRTHGEWMPLEEWNRPSMKQ